MTDNKNKAGRDPSEIVIATATFKDGRKEDITSARFFEMLHHVVSLQPGEQNPNEPNEKELLEMFAELLRVMVDFEIDPGQPVPEWYNDGKTLKNLQIILRHVSEILANFDEWKAQTAAGAQAVDDITKFLEGQRDFIPVARPRLIEDFLKINDSGTDVTRKFKNSTITFTGRLGLNEQKIAEIIRMSFTAMNPYKATNNLKTLVNLSLTDTMTALGRTVTPASKKKFVRQLTREILPTIAHAHITLESTRGEGVEVMHMEIGGGFFEVSTKKDQILFRLSPEYAQYLNSNSLSQYYRETLRLGSAKDHNELPYYLAIKLQDHYFKDANRQRETNMILSVKSVLEFCADTLQYYDILETDPTHWKRKIKERLEKALNEIQAAGVFKWEYCGPALREIPQAAIDGADFYKWSELYIAFQLIPKEPDQSERLQHKQERIEKAREKQEQEDDKATVEADKIRKRRRKKSAQNKKKVPLKPPKGTTEAPKGTQ